MENRQAPLPALREKGRDRIDHSLRTQDQGRASRKRREDLLGRDVEAQRGELESSLARTKAKPVRGTPNVIRYRPVLDLDAFGFAGGAGGVDDVGEVLVGGLARGVFFAFPGDLGPVRIQMHALGLPRKAVGQTLLRQHQLRPRIFEHEAQPFARVRRVQRQVRPARLQNPQKPNDHLQRPLDTQAHQNLSTHTALSQIPRQPVGPLVQLAVRQPLALQLHRHGLRRPLRLLLEEPVHRLVPRILRLRLVPLHQNLMTLPLRQQRQLRQRPIGIFRNCSEQDLQVRNHPPHHRGVEKIRVVPERGRDLLTCVRKVGNEVKFGCRHVYRQRTHGDTREPRPGVSGVLQHHHDLKERRMTQGPLRVQLLDQPLEGKILMGIGLDRNLAHPSEQLPKGRITR